MNTTSHDEGSLQNWRGQLLLIGAGIGALLGVSTAYLLARTAEESRGGPPQIKTGDAVKAAVGVIGIMRAIAALGSKEK